MRRTVSLPLGRLQRLFRKIIGPSKPLPNEEITGPSSSVLLSCTTPYRGYTLLPDPPIHQFNKSLKLYVFLIPILCAWFIGNVFLIRAQYYLPGTPDIIGCTDSFFSDWPPDSCGLNATLCEPSLDGGSSNYRCMGGCRDVTLGNPRWVGDTQVNKVPLIVGGGGDGYYRADSWVCASAITAGIIPPTGGCLTANPFIFPMNITSYPSMIANGLSSISFPSTFPGAFTLSPLSAPGCTDLHPYISIFNALMLFFTTLLLHPPPYIIFSILIIIGYFQIVLVSDPPNVPPFWEDIIGGILPIIFTGYWIYHISFKRTIGGFSKMPLELAFWQGAGFWIGVECYTIFAKLPINRLGYDKLDPAGVSALTIILVGVVVVVVLQAWDMRKLGLLQYYLLWYLLLVPTLLILAFIPDYTLRLHHYILALLAIPVLSLPNRISLFFQSFMLGLWLDGVGRWGWASILQYTPSLLGDAASGTPIPLLTPSNTTDLLSWSNPLNSTLQAIGVTGISLLVNDILAISDTNSTNTTLKGLGLNVGLNQYFRVAYFANGTSLDYSDPIVRLANGTWTN